MNINVKDKVAIVTGASKGIGASMAQQLAASGAKVIVSSRKQESVDEVVAAIKSKGFEATAIACHVGEEQARQHLINETVRIYGRVDILINNAAINPVHAGIARADEALFDKVMDVNVKSCLILSNLCFPIMKEQGSGSIIHIASVEGMRPSLGLGVYSISKAALIMLAKSQAKEWSKYGIRVNAICPGLIKTKFSQALWENDAMLKQYENHLPARRIAEPDELAGLALFLASDASSFCTGGVYTADGGHMIAG